MKERVHEIGEEDSEQAGPEQEPREDLTGHVGLAEPPDDRGHEPRGEEDDDELIEQMERGLLCSRADGGFPAGRRAREQGDDQRAGQHYGSRVTRLR